MEFDSLLSDFFNDLTNENGGCFIRDVTDLYESFKGNNFLEGEYLCRTLIETAWSKLHTGYWKDVPVVWRDLYTLSNFFMANILLSKSTEKNTLREAIKTLDMALIMGGPRFKSIVLVLIKDLHEKCTRDETSFTKPLTNPRKMIRDPSPTIPPERQIKKISPPSIFKFM
eukprot:TRINITY_DN7428_c0_g1_i2.p1 TRINITY_DN7428_c0_g1~~TRINITY_DN7428_c0_g1_i2.p1  ORF type:complete len:170 (+),score=7.60 TRINITY_DN7428_c0_g1_i2:2-511(+)